MRLKDILEKIPDDWETFASEAISDHGYWLQIEVDGEHHDVHFSINDEDEECLDVIAYECLQLEDGFFDTNTRKKTYTAKVRGFGARHANYYSDLLSEDDEGNLVILCLGCSQLFESVAQHASSIDESYGTPRCEMCGL